MEPAGLVALALAASITVRVVLHHVDKENIQQAARSKGLQDVEIHWTPFAPGWFWEKSERHYTVRYRDESGERQERICKTSMFTGVYWRD